MSRYSYELTCYWKHLCQITTPLTHFGNCVAGNVVTDKGDEHVFVLGLTPALAPTNEDGDAVQCVAVCCSVLQCVAVCCSVVQCGAVWCGVVHPKP